MLFTSFVAIRQLERKALVKGAFLQGLNISLALICPTLATMGTFCVHVATGKDLTTSQVCRKSQFYTCCLAVLFLNFLAAGVSLRCSQKLALTCLPCMPLLSFLLFSTLLSCPSFLLYIYYNFCSHFMQWTESGPNNDT